MLSLSNSMDANLIELVGTDIAYWSSELLILHRSHMSNMQLATLTAALNVLKQDQCALQQLVQVHAIPISSPSPTPTTHKKGEELKSMSAVSAPSQSAAPLALSSQLHSTGNRQVILRAEYSAGRIDFFYFNADEVFAHKRAQHKKISSFLFPFLLSGGRSQNIIKLRIKGCVLRSLTR